MTASFCFILSIFEHNFAFMSLDTIIEFRNANIFQGKNLVLSDVNFIVEKTEFIYLIGKTGSGKSSILKTLYADVPLKDGTCKLSEFELHKLPTKKIPYLRRKLGIVFQDFQLMSDRSVNDNLMFVLKATGWKSKTEMEQRTKDVLDKVGLSTKGYKYPNELSGGEQQRVSIARALLNDPDLILADEPTGNLDPETSDSIIKLLFEISKSGRAILMATHDYSIIRKYPSRILKCENSKILECSVSDLNHL